MSSRAVACHAAAKLLCQSACHGLAPVMPPCAAAGGFEVRKGDLLLISPLTIQQKHENFSNPEAFQLQR